ncbi:MAG: class I SAM-dependent methyltransferase [Chloroflexi bacterium]|nr:class I SAM-dependent methyltransferase [Chloroflexota bacterium]
MAPGEWAGLRALRRRLLAGASGRVLEVGLGTGLSLPFYPSVTVLVGIDPNRDMLTRAARRGSAANRVLTLLMADGRSLPFVDVAFDTVVGSLVFCSVPDPLQGLIEARRVTRPGGELRLLEHVRGLGPVVGKLQDWATPIWKRMAQGCHLNRTTLDTVCQAGWRVDSVVQYLAVQVITAHNPGAEGAAA